MRKISESSLSAGLSELGLMGFSGDFLDLDLMLW